MHAQVPHTHDKSKYSEGNGDEDATHDDQVCVTTVDVPRESAHDLSLERFYDEYVTPGRPVIITNGLPPSLASWTLNTLEAHCGEETIQLRTPRKGAWAGLAPTQNTTLAAFLTHLNTHETDSPPRQQPYLFDHPLTTCKDLPRPDIPVYFAHDFLQRVSPSLLANEAHHLRTSFTSYRDYWPSLFVGPAGTVSDLHMDGWCANFWSALLKGRKRWTIFRKEDASRLYRNHVSGSFQIKMDMFELTPPNETIQPPHRAVCLKTSHTSDYPLVHGVTAMRADVVPGELLFVPAQSPHWVENIQLEEDERVSVGVAGNYIDASNIGCATKALKAMGIDHPDARALGAVLGQPSFDKTMNLKDTHRWHTWDAYKNQWAQPLPTS
eukprot:m.216886 g.216886  ORF g.216886 m.216886 type:complete len:381 (+) comp28652_c0_seq1:744-1886(+)